MRPVQKSRRWYQDLSLRWKLNLIVIVSVVAPLTLLVALYTGLSRGLIVDNFVEIGARNLELVSGSLDGLLRHADDLSRIVVSDSYLQTISSQQDSDDISRSFAEEFEARIVLDGIIQQRDIVSSVLVVFNDGRVFGSGHVDMASVRVDEGLVTRMAGVFPHTWSTPVVIPTRPISYELNTDLVDAVALVRQFISVDRADVVGSIVLNIRTETMEELFLPWQRDTRSTTVLVANDGSVLASSNPEYRYRSINEIPHGPLRDTGQYGGAIAKVEGVRSLVTYRPIPEHDWTLIRSTPLWHLLRTTRWFILLIIGIGIVCLIVAVIISIPIANSVTTPLVDLTEAMDLAGQGELEVRVPERGNDEIGKMTMNFNKMVGQISSLMSEVHQEHADKREFELMALQAQMRPHFLYNALDGICALVQLNRTEDAFQMTKALSLFYRGALSGGRNVIALREEIAIVEQYLKIQSFRYTGRFDYQIDVPPELLDRKALKLSLQPIVENAIYHGLRGLPRLGQISISAEDFGSQYEISVLDNGRGFPDTVNQGFGLSSLRERIELYFGPEGLLKVDSCPGETRVSLRLPSDGRWRG